MTRNFIRALGSVLALVLVVGFTPAHAQTTPASSAQRASGSGEEIGLLADLVKPCKDPNKADECDTPRAARPSTIGDDSPWITREAYKKRYPQMGDAGFDRLRGSNQKLCERGNEFMSYIFAVDEGFQKSDVAYQALNDIYDRLPTRIKAATAVMTAAQAISGGFLCALSAGNYCIAVLTGAAGNIVTGFSSASLQLANVKLSIANIQVTRLNIYSNRITLRLDAFWLDLVVPYCNKAFPDQMTATIKAGSYSASMSDLGAPPVFDTPLGLKGSHR